MATTDPDIAADPSVAQLADALRAGPGSPEWHAVVTRLRREGVEPEGTATGEQKMLVAVRELLEQGKDYRTVRAGPGFTRKLMRRIDEERSAGNRGSGAPMSTMIAIVGGLLVTAIVAGIVVVVIRSSGGGIEGQKSRLRAKRFDSVIATASFDGKVPEGWSTIGELPLDASAGLGVAVTQPAATERAAGIESIATIDADEGGVIEALVRVPSDPRTVVQLFVRDHRAGATTVSATAATPASGAFSGELAWVLQDGKSRVALPPNGKFAGAGVPFEAGTDGVLVRVAIGERVAIVTAGTREIYAGPSNLSDNEPRTFGIRFLTKGSRAATEAIVLSARVAKP